MPGHALSRRAALALGGLSAVAGCGSSPLAGELPGAAPDPVPRRVVALGPTDVQVAQALGARLVAVTRNPTRDDGLWTGLVGPLPDDVVLLEPDQPDLETVVGLRPDVVLATTARPAHLALLGRLETAVPVLAPPAQPLQSSGDDLARAIGRALGRDVQAERLVSRSDRQVEEARAAHPEWRRVTCAFGLHVDGTTWVLTSRGSQAAQFLSRLGVRIEPGLAALDDERSRLGSAAAGMTELGPEQVTRLADADLVLISTWGAGSAEAFVAQPLLRGSALARPGRLRMISPDLATPLLEPNPATTPWLLRRLEPHLHAAAGVGDQRR